MNPAQVQVLEALANSQETEVPLAIRTNILRQCYVTRKGEDLVITDRGREYLRQNHPR